MITGERREGTISTFYTLFRKMINSFMAYIVGASIDAFGYNPKITAPSMRPARTIWGLRLNFSILPTIFAIITLITVWRYTMTKRDHEQIKALIKQSTSRAKLISTMKKEAPRSHRRAEVGRYVDIKPDVSRLMTEV